MKTHYAVLLLLLALNSSVYGNEKNQPAIFWKQGKCDVDIKALVARNDVVYLSPAVDRPEGLPLGNGRLGAMVWNEDLLNVQLNHGALWRHFQLVSSGRLHLKTVPELKTDLIRFEERLKLYDGSLVMTGETKNGKVNATCFIAEGSDVMVIRVRDERKGTRSYRLDLEFWRKPSVIQTRENLLLE